MEELQSKEVAVRRKDDEELRRAGGGHVSLAGVVVFQKDREREREREQRLSKREETDAYKLLRERRKQI